MWKRVEAIECTCEACGNCWVVAQGDLPKRCGSCKSRKWNMSTGTTNYKTEVVLAGLPTFAVATADLDSAMESSLAPTVPLGRCEHRMGSVCDECAKKRKK